MALNLTPQQWRTARTAVRAARGEGARHRELVALLEAGLVEKNLIHTPGGDADSQGFLQQRPSQGWGPFIPGRRGIRVDTRQFISQAEALRGRGLTAGQLAQAVQRSAFPGRYGERKGEAVAILRALGGGSASPRGGGGAVAQHVAGRVYGLEPLRPGQPSGSLATSVKQAPPMSAPQAPLQPVLPMPSLPGGAPAVPEESGAPAPKVSTQDLLGQLGQSGPQLAPVTVGGSGRQRAGGNGHGVDGAVAPGRVHIAPGANLPGRAIRKPVVRFVGEVAGMVGHPLTIGTGTNHSRLTINGTVSDHASGNAADVPLMGKALVAAGRAALIAAGMSPERARRINGGGFNVGGWQIIFNTDAPGWGNHLTHLHVGRRVR